MKKEIKVGSRVKVINSGKCYTTYTEFFEKHLLKEYIDRYKYGVCAEGGDGLYKVEFIGKNRWGGAICVISNGYHIFLINIDGLELYEEDKEDFCNTNSEIPFTEQGMKFKAVPINDWIEKHRILCKEIPATIDNTKPGDMLKCKNASVSGNPSMLTEGHYYECLGTQRGSLINKIYIMNDCGKRDIFYLPGFVKLVSKDNNEDIIINKLNEKEEIMGKERKIKAAFRVVAINAKEDEVFVNEVIIRETQSTSSIEKEFTAFGLRKYPQTSYDDIKVCVTLLTEWSCEVPDKSAEKSKE